jgi:ABC-2 type transport system permease protein
MRSNLLFFFSSLWLNLLFAFQLNLEMGTKIIASTLKHVMFVLAWKPFYLSYSNINGWDYKHHLFTIGLITIGIGLTEVFFDGLRDLPQMIECGSLDRFLTIPRDPILTLAMSKSCLHSLSDILAGTLMLLFSELATAITILLIFFSSLFFFSIYLYLGSLRFFINESNTIILDLYSKTILIAMQPNSSYTGLLKIITHSILPVCLVSFYPTEYIRNKNFLFLLISIIGTVLFYLTARSLFFFGLTRYESANRGTAARI